MKKKNLLTLASAALCAIVFASCSNASVTAFSANWYANTTIGNIVEGTSETLTYSVTMKEEPAAGKPAAYYTDGKYTTTLSTEIRDGEQVYSYQTALDISVQFMVDGETSEKFKDSITSKVVFKNTQAGLQPVRSEKRVYSHSPSSIAPKKLEDFCRLYQYGVEIEYKENCTKATSVYTDYSKSEPIVNSKDFSISDKYSYLDNEQILFALRGVSFASSHQLQRNNSTSTGTSTQLFKATPSAAESEEFEFEMNGTSAKRAIQYYPVALVLSDKNPGSTQTAWYAATTNNTSNTYRNVLLKLEAPLYYNLGTLVYTLKTANFASA